RRIGHGRLSEIFGRATIAQDRFLRTVGFGRAARTAWEQLPADARRQIDAYVAGVNAFIAGHPGRRLPPEFALLRFAPEPWSGPDVLAWVKMMAWDLSANYLFELMRHDIEARVGVSRMADLLPPYPPHGLSIVSAQDATEATRATRPLPREARSAPVTAGSSLQAFLIGLSSGPSSILDLLLVGSRT